MDNMVIQFEKAEELKKSTAARKDVHGGGDVIQSSKRLVERSGTSSKANPTTDMGIAGNQALPVDNLPKPKMGRPRTGYIKAEYNRQYSADKRAALKLGISVPEYRALHTPYPVDENTTTK